MCWDSFVRKYYFYCRLEHSAAIEILQGLIKIEAKRWDNFFDRGMIV
jgi:hypothetical protein